jgi:hypothetical protein
MEQVQLMPGADVPMFDRAVSFARQRTIWRLRGATMANKQQSQP